MAKRDQKGNRQTSSGKNKSSAGYNQKMGAEFLQQNEQKDGVIATDSGLQYKIVEKTSGVKPEVYNSVIVHQRALLLNGNILIDTYRKNKPDEVKLEDLIEGVREGILLMCIGDRYKFWIPPELAWGRKGSTGKIPPFAVLCFDIRLIDVL